MKTIIDPVYGVNYDRGYCGFSYLDYSVVSRGIAFFNRDEADGIIPSHAFLVVDENTIIEADYHGVHTTPITKYFDNPNYTVFFKKPRDLTEERANLIVNRAEAKLGAKYDFILSLYFIERWLIRKIFRSEQNTQLPSIFDNERFWVCSELCADAYLSIDDYAGQVPLLTHHPSKIGPFVLFNSPIFQPWKF